MNDDRPRQRTRTMTVVSVERSISDAVVQTHLANEMLESSRYYPFPRRFVCPTTREVASLVRCPTDMIILKRGDDPDVRISAREGFSRRWSTDDVAQQDIRGREIRMMGAMCRRGGTWFVDTGDATREEAKIMRYRLKGFGAIVNAGTLSVDGAWGYLIFVIRVVVSTETRDGRIVDARATNNIDRNVLATLNEPGTRFRKM